MITKTSRRARSSGGRAAPRPGPRKANPRLGPARLLQLGLGFWGPRTFLSAVELGLFSALAKGALDEGQLRERLALHPRSARDFFDALVALGILERKAGKYRNAADADAFLDRAKPAYVGGILEMAAARLYPYWGSLTEALHTGAPQNEAKRGGDVFGALYADPERLRGFLAAMTGVSMASARAIASKFPWKKYRTFVDVGTAQGCVPVQVSLAHKHLRGAGFDLPPVGPIYEQYVSSFGLDARLKFQAGNFFRDPLPQADVLIMGHILHDWNLQEKHLLLQKAFAALPKHGTLIVYDAMIDDARCRNVMGLLMSLNMLIETPGGFDYTPADCRGWMKTTGFRKTSVVPLTAVESMVIATR
ncbi:MAG: methyltransferase [Steroidobacteraceae bacterium]